MHRSHSSRGRILFEVFCALTVSASCAGAWLQTGATALMPAAAAAALYGLVHAFDMRRDKPAEAIEAQRIGFEPEIERDLPAIRHAEVTPSAENQPPTAAHGVEEAVVVELAAPPAKPARRAKAPRKGGRRASAPKDAMVSEPTPLEAGDVTELVSSNEAAVPWPMASDEPAHPHIEPLFEPEPFARMPRRAFGRRGRI